MTLQTLSVQVTVVAEGVEGEGEIAGKRAVAVPGSVEWRRWGGIFVYSSGALSGSKVFHIYPGELFLRVDLKAPSPGLRVSVKTL